MLEYALLDGKEMRIVIAKNKKLEPLAFYFLCKDTTAAFQDENIDVPKGT